MRTGPGGKTSFGQSRVGWVLAAVLLAAGIYLVLAHWAHVMEFMAQYLILVALLVCVGMHFFMHRHGGHGSRRDENDTSHGDKEDAERRP